MIDEMHQKNTTLDDSAEIYQPREKLTEKQKLMDMTFKEKVTYFNNYYRSKTLAILAILILVISTAYSILSPKPERLLNVAVIDYALDNESAETLVIDFGQHIGIDPESEEIIIDTTFVLDSENDTSGFSYASLQKLTTYIAAKELDIIIAPESYFTTYAYNGTLCKLADQLPTDVISELAEDFYYSETEEDSSESAYGIYLNNAPIYDGKGNLMDKPVLGIVINSNYKENATEFILYLFDLN